MSKNLNHYVAKAAITRGLVFGTPAKALCGELVPPEHQGPKAIRGCETAREDFETCPECELFYNGLRKSADEKVPEHV